jgi:hypothetical protein
MLAILMLSNILAHAKDNQAASANYEKALQQLKSGDLKLISMPCGWTVLQANTSVRVTPTT